MAKERENKPAERPAGTTEIEPWKPMDIETMFNDFISDFWSPRVPWRRRSAWPVRAVASQVPAVDLYDQNDEFIVKAEIPGLAKEEVDVSIEGNTLTIKGEKKKQEEVKRQDYYYSERSFGAFSRTVELPSPVQPDKVNATFTNGVLEIRLPKTEEAKKNVIKVKVA
jgi:HSP20 family protein